MVLVIVNASLSVAISPPVETVASASPTVALAGTATCTVAVVRLVTATLPTITPLPIETCVAFCRKCVPDAVNVNAPLNPCPSTFGLRLRKVALFGPIWKIGFPSVESTDVAYSPPVIMLMVR